MNDTNNYDEKESELQKLVDEVASGSEQAQERHDDSAYSTEAEQQQRADILNLPPRNDVHSNRRKRAKFKISGASARLLSVIVILIVILGVSFYLWGEEIIDAINQM